MTRARLAFQFWQRGVREWLLLDSVVSKTLLASAGFLLGMVLLALGRRERAVDVLARIHRADLFAPADRAIERLFRRALDGSSGRFSGDVRSALHEYPFKVGVTRHTQRFFDEPLRLLNGCAIVLKSPGVNEKGVLYLYYSYVYALMVRFFDIAAIAERYHLVLEPSWSGFCDQNILGLSSLPHPIFVGSIEPRDTAFLKAVSANFVPVWVSGNTWVDPRVFKPLPGVQKDFDLVMVSGWAPYKRHWAFFRALKEMKRAGSRPRVALIGFPQETTADVVMAEARYYGVDDLVHVFERLSPADVNLVFNRSKVNVLWSRREGVNRAIIEGMAAGLPCVVRAGFNYGYHYPYINATTGCFATERELPRVLRRMIDTHASFDPRPFILPRMTPEASTATLNAEIKAVATGLGERWTRDLVVKVSTLDGLTYGNPADKVTFEDDDRFLRSSRVTRSQHSPV